MDKRTLITGLAWDIALPAVVFYVLDAAGVDTALALAAGGAAALLRVAAVAAVHRRLDGVAAVVAAGCVLVLAVSLITGDPRVLLARESLLTGALGLLLVGSCAIGKPALYALVRRAHSGNPAMLTHLAQRWHDDPGFRARFTLPSLVIGGVLLVESVARIVLICTLPLEVMPGVSTSLHLGAIAILVVFAMWLRNRRRRAGTGESLTTPAGFRAR